VVSDAATSSFFSDWISAMSSWFCFSSLSRRSQYPLYIRRALQNGCDRKCKKKR